MTSIVHELPPFENVPAAAAGTALLPRIPQGEIYDGIVLKLGGTFVAADISEITVKLGGKTIVECTGAELDAINKYYGLTNDADYLPIHFADRKAKTERGRRIGAVDTKNFTYNEFSMQVKLDGTQTGATLTGLGIIGGEKPKDVAAMFRALVKSEPAPGSAATHNLQFSTGSDVGNLIRALHINHTNVTHFELMKDSVSIVNKLAIADLQFLAKEVHRSIQAGWFTYDPIMNAEQGDVLDTRRANGLPASMQYKVTTSGSDTLSVLADLYATIGTL